LGDERKGYVEVVEEEFEVQNRGRSHVEAIAEE
jgi:hypothetical protein